MTLPPAEGRPSRHVIECLHCLRADPDAEAGHIAAGIDLDEVRRVMSNHLAQRHDILPTTSPGDEP